MQIQGVNQSRYEYSAYEETRPEQPEFNLSFPENDDSQRKSTLTCLHVPTGETVRISADKSDPGKMIAEIKTKDGNISEKNIDLTDVNPRHASFVEMLAVSSSLRESGKMSGVPGIFESEVFSSILGTGYDIHEKQDFISMMKQEMTNLMKYGYMDVYARHKPEYDLLMGMGQ